jgi:hypothetical protein
MAGVRATFIDAPFEIRLADVEEPVAECDVLTA